MKNFNTIIFDFGGVIFNIDFNSVNKAFTDLGVEHFEDMYSQKKADPLFQQLEEGKLTEEEFYNAFRKRANVDLMNEEIKDAWNALLIDYRVDALNTLQELKSKYQILLLSNTNHIHLRAFRKIYNDQIGEGSFEDHFHKVYYSHEIGFRKPDEEAYEYVLKERNLAPSECLFIDDSIQNIEAAKAVGLQTIFLQKGMTIEGLNL